MAERGKERKKKKEGHHHPRQGHKGSKTQTEGKKKRNNGEFRRRRPTTTGKEGVNQAGKESRGHPTIDVLGKGRGGKKKKKGKSIT